MAEVQLGLVVPADALDKRRRGFYMRDVSRLLTIASGRYHSAWLIDHLQFGGSDLLEGWTALSYLAALYPKLQWGHSVLCQSFRNPALIAKMAATLQQLSGGRYILGIGAGWHREEYSAYGYTFHSPGRRVEELDETLQIIRAMWTLERTTFSGKYYHVENAWCEPKPDPIPPVMVGAFGPKMLRLAARHADWWNVSSTPIETYREYAREFGKACRAEGRDPASVRRAWSGGCVCAPSEMEIGKLAAARGPDLRYEAGEDFVGTPGQIIEQMLPFVELGVTYFMLDCGGFPNTTTAEMLAYEVLPYLNRSLTGDAMP